MPWCYMQMPVKRKALSLPVQYDCKYLLMTLCLVLFVNHVVFLQMACPATRNSFASTWEAYQHALGRDCSKPCERVRRHGPYSIAAKESLLLLSMTCATSAAWILWIFGNLKCTHASPAYRLVSRQWLVAHVSHWSNSIGSSLLQTISGRA